MNADLDRFVAADTVLSDVDGEAGRLIIRGHDLEELAGHVSFEDAVLLLWSGVVPGACGDADELQQRLGAARVNAYRRMQERLMPAWPADALHVMRVLLAAEVDGTPIDALAASAVAAALGLAHAQRRAAPVPDASRSHAADLLRLLRAREGSDAEVAAFETYLVAAIDHGLNASTFTARVVASTRAGLSASVVAAFAALTGPLHGGAPGPVLDMLDAVGSPDRAMAWVEAALARGERLMGFGHRIYRVRDPRADVLKAALLRLSPASAAVALAEAVEAAALAALNRHRPTRRLDTNTEFYTAMLLSALEIDRAAFTPVFAAARTAGWIAHIREQEALDRLIRPLSRYVGVKPRRAA